MNKKILIVDDDKDLREMMQLLLQQKGYTVIVAGTCEDGISAFYRENPDLILLDINVHDEDGREVCRKIKSDAQYYHIPVIMISGNAEALKTYKTYGANDIMEKPFDFDMLQQMVASYLDK